MTITYNNVGYTTNTNSEALLDKGYNNGIYNNGESSWLASPYKTFASDVMCSLKSSDDYITASNIIGNYGLRPMVIIPTSNFQFNIID